MTRLLTVKAKYYVVQRGDTLSEITRRVGVAWRKLATQNDLINPHLIFPGQLIFVGAYQ